MHVADFEDDYLPLAQMNNDMLLRFHTTTTNADDVLPPPKNNKDVNGTPEKEQWRAACIEEIKGKQEFQS
eukprot:2649594-Pleurochrysis_carterae.AAC.2